MKKIILVTISILFAANSLQANADCQNKHPGLLNMKEYKACVNNSPVAEKPTKELGKTSKFLGKVGAKLKLGALNTDSTLFKTGKYKKDK
jgi:hypothetical protein